MTAVRPAAWFDQLVIEVLNDFTTGRISQTEAVRRTHQLVDIEDWHAAHLDATHDEREPHLSQLIAEREGRRPR